MKFWINHPRLGLPDTMLTLAVIATLTCLLKVLLNGVVLKVVGHSLECGSIDGGLIAATLTPTLGAYVARKMKDSPDKAKDSSKDGSTDASA